MQINVLAVEYKGYGIYSGKANSKSIIEDSLNVYDYITDALGVPQDSIIILGRSIGSGPATYVASNRNPCCLILLAAFKSIRDIIKDKSGRTI